MKKALYLVVAAVLLASFSLAGCQTAGKVTGKVVKGTEEAAKDFKKGYKDGRK